ncbi:MAG: glucosyl-3-phosphoglycerate synthase [Thermoleophilia bacterium]|nr:glucosyl-3-phosphoglycerate synthase [Thermoleophilia bacterium]
MLKTFEHTDFPVAALLAERTGRVSVVIPTRSTAGTIAHTVSEIEVLADAGLVGQILVVDADSPDGTAAAARDAGAEVISENDLAPGLGPVRGKGDAMWRSLEAVRGELVVFVDGDVADFGRHYVTGLLGPLIRDPAVQFVKGSYRRPFRQEGSEQPAGGGRVTELTARPLLRQMVPELTCFDQPLAGEIAARRDLLDRVPFTTGYGVEIAMLVDVWDRVGLEAMAQVALGTKRNTHQTLAALGGMASEVVTSLGQAVSRIDRPGTGALRPADGLATELEIRPSRVRSGAPESLSGALGPPGQ